MLGRTHPWQKAHTDKADCRCHSRRHGLPLSHSIQQSPSLVCLVCFASTASRSIESATAHLSLSVFGVAVFVSCTATDFVTELPDSSSFLPRLLRQWQLSPLLRRHTAHTAAF